MHVIRELTRVVKHLENVRCHTDIISFVWKVLVYKHSVFLSSKIVYIVVKLTTVTHSNHSE